MANEEMDKEFLEIVVKALVENPDAVKVVRTVDEMGVLLTLDVDAQDMGTIIGRGGATARAIRTLLRVVGLKGHARVNLKINEPEGGKRAPVADATPDVASAGDDVDQAMEDLKL